MIYDCVEVIFEPYCLNMVNLDKDKCAHVSNCMRINEEDYLQLFPDDRGLITGIFIYCKGGYLSPDMSRFGDYTYANGMYFLEEERANFYA